MPRLLRDAPTRRHLVLLMRIASTAESVHSRLPTNPGPADKTRMYTPRSINAPPDTDNTDHYAIYDQLPPIQPTTLWRRAFPTLGRLSSSIRHHDDHAAAA